MERIKNIKAAYKTPTVSRLDLREPVLGGEVDFDCRDGSGNQELCQNGNNAVSGKGCFTGNSANPGACEEGNDGRSYLED